MLKKNTSLKLIKYYNYINYNLIYANKAINRYKRENYEISQDKAKSLELLKKAIFNIKNCSLKKQAKNIVFCDGNPKSKMEIQNSRWKSIKEVEPGNRYLLRRWALTPDAHIESSLSRLPRLDNRCRHIKSARYTNKLAP